MARRLAVLAGAAVLAIAAPSANAATGSPPVTSPDHVTVHAGDDTYKHQTFHCEWRPLGSDKVEGRATVKPRSTVVIRVYESELEVNCDSPRSGVGAVFEGSDPARVRRAWP